MLVGIGLVLGGVRAWPRACLLGMSSIWQGTSVYRLGPSQVNGLHRSLNTGSKRTRKPPGNSTK